MSGCPRSCPPHRRRFLCSSGGGPRAAYRPRASAPAGAARPLAASRQTRGPRPPVRPPRPPAHLCPLPAGRTRRPGQACARDRPSVVAGPCALPGSDRAVHRLLLDRGSQARAHPSRCRKGGGRGTGAGGRVVGVAQRRGAARAGAVPGPFRPDAESGERGEVELRCAREGLSRAAAGGGCGSGHGRGGPGRGRRGTLGITAVRRALCGGVSVGRVGGGHAGRTQGRYGRGVALRR